ncbi:MAG: ABC transporter ATP-binding protein [Planctomycetota bacterium]
MATRDSETPAISLGPAGEMVYQAIARIATALEVQTDRARAAIDCGDQYDPETLSEQLIASARMIGVQLTLIDDERSVDQLGALDEGYVWVRVQQGRIDVVGRRIGGRFGHTQIDNQVVDGEVTRGGVAKLLRHQGDDLLLLAKRNLDCQALGVGIVDEGYTDTIPQGVSLAGGGGHSAPSPISRFVALLNLERRDIFLVIIFGLVAGVLALATPLAVESLINVVSWGIAFQPLVVLGVILFACLGMAGVLRLLQVIVVEMIQRRQFVRIVGDLSHRFARVRLQDLEGEFPRESANRVFDVMTIQKASSTLLTDGIALILTTILGMILLAFYHPLLLGFDAVLVIAMVGVTWVLGRGGIRTAISESKTKYKVVHWLQDVLDMPEVFKVGGGETLAVRRANQLTSDYIRARTRQFRVLIRQTAFAISLQVIASTVVLALGGYLVIEGQLTLGQLVASEFVVTVVVGAFAKAGKSLEKYYDVMAGIDKVGHLIDYSVDPRTVAPLNTRTPFPVRWSDLSFDRPSSRSTISASQLSPGSVTALIGNDPIGVSDLARSMAGLATPDRGVLSVGPHEPASLAGGGTGEEIGYVGVAKIFHGTIQENIDLGRLGIGIDQVAEVLNDLQLAEVFSSLPDGLQTKLQTDGYPLDSRQSLLLNLARAIVVRPNLLILDHCLDRLDRETVDRIWPVLTGRGASWTLVVATVNPELARRCKNQISVRGATPAIASAESNGRDH